MSKESIINFHRAEVFAIKTKHFFVRDVLGIKGAFPFLIGKAAGANVEVHMTSNFRIHLRRNISELDPIVDNAVRIAALCKGLYHG